MRITLTVNGEEREVAAHHAESLLHVLRESLGLLGAKDACLQGECGSCTVLLDGDPVCSCLVMAADAADAEVLTVEGLGSDDELHPVQQAFLDHGAVQCGFCTPGFLMSTVHLLEHNPVPTGDEIREALAGNICRCTGYGAVLRAVESLVGEVRP
jgi:carbon-monoxide dehydrogenase small subunit